MKLKSEPVTMESLHDDCVALEESLNRAKAQRDALLAAAKDACAYLKRLPQFPDRGFDVAAIRKQCEAAIRLTESA